MNVFVFWHLKQREIRHNHLPFCFWIAEPTNLSDQLGLLNNIEISALSSKSIFFVSILDLRFYLFCAFDLVFDVAYEVVKEHQICRITCIMIFSMDFNFRFLVQDKLTEEV